MQITFRDNNGINIIPHDNTTRKPLFDKNKPLSNRNIAIFESMKKEEFTLRDIYYYAKELYRHNKLERSKKMFVKFIKSNEGYIEDIIDSYYVLSMIYKKENDFKNALKALFERFNYDIPRANILSEIGSIYLQKQDIKKAIYYYQLALNCSKNNKSFILKDYYGYIPCIQLSVCYYFLNDIDSAIKYNELANTYKKEGKEYMHNKDFYKKLIKID